MPSLDQHEVFSKNGAPSQWVPAFIVSGIFPPKVRPDLSLAPLCDPHSPSIGPRAITVSIMVHHVKSMGEFTAVYLAPLNPFGTVNITM